MKESREGSCLGFRIQFQGLGYRLGLGLGPEFRVGDFRHALKHNRIGHFCPVAARLTQQISIHSMFQVSKWPHTHNFDGIRIFS
jgi:hypothetical protein